ncbi:plasmid protein [Sulfurisphaera ohwakuensis]|uniref:plasmid protein n=1 Tax=Sulfurisphaera ohwakuensis TaxID=69656 RepID=UPI0036F1F191
MGLVRRHEKGETYYYYYNKGERIYLGKLTDRTVIDKIKYISSNLDSLSEEERKEFLSWINELKAVLGLIPQSSDTNKLDTIDRKLDKVLELLEGRKKSIADLDRAYEMMKNSLGHVRIDLLRKQLGMSLEQFMNEFGDYILQNYELIQGGDEGFVKNGIVYGIIRRKVFEGYTGKNGVK